WQELRARREAFSAAFAIGIGIDGDFQVVHRRAGSFRQAACLDGSVSSCQLPASSKNWELGTRIWKLEAGSWKLATGSWRLATSERLSTDSLPADDRARASRGSPALAHP